jgi:hypothetical protein
MAMHPLFAGALDKGLKILARATASAVDSMLKDVGSGLGAAHRGVQRRRENIRRRVRESGREFDPNEEFLRDEEE